MTEETETAPAGTEAMDVAAAAALFDKQEQAAAEKTEQPAETNEVAEATTATTETAPEAQPEQSEEPAREAEPEEQSYDLDKIHGNTKIRLRDGTEWSAADLKRRIGDLQDVEKKRATFTEEFQKFQAERSQTQQQAQLFAQIAPQAIAAIQASLPEVPPLPDQSLAATDPFAYNEKLAAHMTAKDARDKKLDQMRQVQQAAYQTQMRAEQERAANLAAAVQQQRQILLERNPEFADPVKAQAFQSKFLKHGREWGFSDQELGAVYDARIIDIAKKAMAYEELMAAKPKAVSTKPVPAASTQPVQSGGQRATPAQQRQVQRQELFQKARKSGDIREIAEMWAQLDN